MRHTLKAVFEHRSDAQHVLDELLASGYPRADLALADISTTEPTGLGATLRHTAARLLGTLHHQDAEAHRHVVTLTTESDPEAERAAGIIARAHPAGLEDIPDERDAVAAAAALRRRYPPGTAPGSLQHHPHEDSHYFGTQNAGAPPAGNTYQETLGSIARWSDPDEVDPFTLGAAPEPAEDLRAGDNGPGQAWEQVEPTLKSDWESRHPGSAAAAWDKVKAAMRHGWERARH
jgi:hypothetical protein